MLSITNNQQLNFRRNDNKVTDSDVQKYEKVQDELDCADSFVSENIEQTKPKHRNPVSKFFRNIALGTALAGGLTAAAPQAAAQNVPVGKVITEQKQVDPRDPSKGTGTYYYSNKEVLDSATYIYNDANNAKETAIFDRSGLNSYPVIKYAETDISPDKKVEKYKYTITPDNQGGYTFSPYISYCSYNIINRPIKPDKTKIKYKTPNENKPIESQYINETSALLNSEEATTIEQNENKIVKRKTFIDNHDGKQQKTVTYYYTIRPVLDSVVVKKTNGVEETTRLIRNKGTQQIYNINTTDTRGKNWNYYQISPFRTHNRISDTFIDNDKYTKSNEYHSDLGFSYPDKDLEGDNYDL